MGKLRRITGAALWLAWHWAGTASAATVILETDKANFQSLLGSQATVTQDFESLAVSTAMSGVEFLPGISATTNLDSLQVVLDGTDKSLFAQTRTLDEAFYDIKVTGGYTALGFDVEGYDPATPGPAYLTVEFADFDPTYSMIPIFPASDPMFFGIYSDTPITRVLWSEGPLADDVTCCETTSLDNFIAGPASPVPLPAAVWLMLSALGAMSVISRRQAT